jgi:hypothetical protein
MGELIHTKPEIPEEPVFNFLSYISDLEFPEGPQSLETIQAFFDYLSLSSNLISFIDTHGEYTVNSPKYKQFRGAHGGERFLATHYPGTNRDGLIKPAIFHANVMPDGKWLSTTSISVSSQSNNPLVRKVARADIHSNWTSGENLSPADSFAEVQHLAVLMLGR